MSSASSSAASELPTGKRVEFDDPSNTPFLIKTHVLASSAHPPVLDPIILPNIFPGSVLKVPLHAADADGDTIQYTIGGMQSLPAGTLTGDGTLVFRPAPSELGSYPFDVIASDDPRILTLLAWPDKREA